MLKIRIKLRTLQKKMYRAFNFYHYEFTSFENILSEKETHSPKVFQNYQKLILTPNGKKVFKCLTPLEHFKVFELLYRNISEITADNIVEFVDVCNVDDMYFIAKEVREDQKEVFEFLLKNSKLNNFVLADLMLRTVHSRINPVSHTILFNLYEEDLRRIVEEKLILERNLKNSNVQETKEYIDKISDFENQIAISWKFLYTLEQILCRDKNTDFKKQSKILFEYVTRGHLYETESANVN